MCLRGFEEVQDDTRVRTPQMKVTRVSVHMADYAANYVVYPWPPKQRCAHLEQPGSHFQQESFWRCELPVALYTSLGKDCLCALDAWMARRLRREQQTGLSLRLTQAQPGRAPPSSCILPLLRMIDGWTSIKLLHQKDLQGKWQARDCYLISGTRWGPPTKSHHREPTSQPRSLPTGSVPCSLLHSFCRGRGNEPKAYLIRLCVGRTSSIPSEMEDYTSPPDGEEKVSRCEHGAYLYWF